MKSEANLDARREHQSFIANAAKRRNNMPGYQSQPVGDGTEFATAPEPVPAPWLLVAIPGGLLVLIALSTGFIYGVTAAGLFTGRCTC